MTPDLKTLRSVAEKAQADPAEEAMDEFCAVFNLPACLSLLDRVEALEGRIREADALAGRLIDRDVSGKIAGEILRYQIARVALPALKDTSNDR